LPRPVAVAITGGIGAGKSEALSAFARHGAATASSDEIVHRLFAGDAEVRAGLRERWGDGVFDGGAVDRAGIAERVFADREELAWLEALLHPRVMREYLAWREDRDEWLTVTEVPLLYETGGEERFDKVVVITAPPAVRAARRRLADEREARLVPEEEKVARADYVYENTGSLQELDRFVADVVEDLSRSSGG
jgi:dephospho-CoA kinase